MSYTTVPAVIVKPGDMIRYWSSKLKVAAVLVAVALYVYCLLLAKTIYARSKRLDHIKAMVIDTEKIINNVHKLDQNLAMNIERVENMFA